MDFLALPRRDLQALCKRNGVRANMTNVAMADALRALPKVDGIEEYVKQPVPVPEPEAKVAVAEEKNAGKQGNPLPRGRRVVAKSSAPVEPEEANEEEKGNAKRQACKEDAPAPGVGRRGASRRAGLVPVVPQLAAMAEEALKREAKRDKAPAPVVGRRGASRRARPSPAVAAQAAESEVAGAEEEQSDKVEDLEREATTDDVPALGVGRRGANRRARAAPSVAAMAGKMVAEEEQRAQIGRCVRAKGTSSEPITLDDSDDDEMENAKPEEQQEDAETLGVGRRERASQRAPAASEAPATSGSAAASKSDAGDVAVEAVPIRPTRQRKPTMKAAAAAAAAEEEAPRRTLRRGAVIGTLVQQEVQEEPQEAVGAPDIAVETVPFRATRQRKPTMKAAVAAEEKAPQRATRRGALQQEMQEQPQDVVIIEAKKMTNETPAENSPVTTCVMPENPAALDEDGDILNEVVQEEKEVLVTDEMLQGTAGMHDDIEDDQFEAVFVQADQVVTTGNLVEQVEFCEITGEENTALIVDEGKQSTVTVDKDVVEDHSKFDGVHSNEQVDVVTIDKVPELKLIEDVFVQADHVVAAENLPKQVTDSEIIVEDTSLLVDEMQQSTVTMDEDVVKDYSETDGVHSNEQMEVVTTDKVPELELKGDVFVQANHVVAAENLREHVTDSEIIVEATSLLVDGKQQSTVTMDENVVKDYSETDVVHSNEQMEVVTTDKVPELELIEDVFDQADHVVAVVNLPEQVIDCGIILETTSLIVDEKQKSTVTMDIDVVNDRFKTDGHADEQMEVATSDEVTELTETDDEGVEMKMPPIVDEKQQRTVTSNGDIVDDYFKTNVAHADEQKEVVATEVPEVTGTDSEIEDKTQLIVDEKKQSITTNGNVVFDHFETDIACADEQKEVTGIVTEVIDEITGIDDEVVEENTVVITEDILNQGTVPSVTNTLDGCAKENLFGIDSGHGNEQKIAITADIEPDVSRAQDGGAREEIALLDDVTESLSKSIRTMEPSVCKNNSGKNSAEPIAVLEEKGVKVASKSEDLTKLSLGQLRAKLKEKLNAKKNKEAKKRVALGRVDENVCRSHAKGQQQDLNLQQH